MLFLDPKPERIAPRRLAHRSLAKRLARWSAPTAANACGLRPCVPCGSARVLGRLHKIDGAPDFQLPFEHQMLGGQHHVRSREIDELYFVGTHGFQVAWLGQALGHIAGGFEPLLDDAVEIRR